MTRDEAWSHYFETGDREPLIKAYWDSINYIAWSRYPQQQEDMFQLGMIGLLTAIEKIDRSRVKSLDAWVWLNVKGKMFNAPKVQPTIEINDWSDSFEEEYEDLRFNTTISSLDARQQQILTWIYRDDRLKTEIGRDLNISSMRVGQIEQQALKKLRLDVL